MPDVIDDPPEEPEDETRQAKVPPPTDPETGEPLEETSGPQPGGGEESGHS